MSNHYKEKKILKENLNFLEDLLHPIELRRDLLFKIFMDFFLKKTSQYYQNYLKSVR